MEPMDVEVAVPSFSSAKLLGLKELVGHDDVTSIANSDFSTDFARCVAVLCQELKTLYDLQESVPQVGEAVDNLGFLLELSSFLGELECPHEEITCGSLEDRLSTPQKRKLLVNYLLNEIKAARLFAKDALSQPVAEGGDKELTPYLASALNAANVPKPAGSVEPLEIITMLHKSTDARLQSCAERPRPLFTAKLDPRQWRKIDKVVEETAQNCRSRALLLLKRIDVTVNSFLWSQRLKPREAQIRELFTKRRAGILIVNPPDVACMLAASQDLLRIEQASNEKVRKNTHAMMSPLALAPRPADRGGRTNEMIGDIAREQASAQRGRGRGGGGGGGFRGQSAPQQSRQQYGQSRDGGYRDQNYGQPRDGGYRDQNYGQPRDQQYGGYGGYGDQQFGGQHQYGMSREQMRMRLLTSTGRLLSRIGSTRSCDVCVVPSIVRRRPSFAIWQIAKRPTTTGAFHCYDKIVIEDSNAALEIAMRLTRGEQKLLREALDDLAARQDMEDSLPMTVGQTRALFLVNSLPFIGFGFLDNLVMILAGEYIDQQLGTLLCLSTMAAAALGNLISDVAGVGLAHYVEGIVNKCGIKHPVLTSEQLESSRARWTTHSGRAIGLSIGCIIGMFPLLFFNNEGDEKSEKKSK